MHALTFWGIQDLRYEEVADPVLTSPDEAIVKVKAVGVCGSDISRYRKLGPYIPGLPWGHEFSGDVVEVGSEFTNVKVGDRVAGNPAMVPDKGSEHPAGMPSQHPKLNAIGALVPGAYAEYVKVPSINLTPMAPTMSFEEGALMEPTTVVLHGLYQTGLQMGDDVAVLGCGNLGLLSVAWARLFGAKTIYAFDILDEKLETARKFGADVTINNRGKEVHELIAEYCEGVDLAIESAGSPLTAAQVLGLPKRGGEVILMGIPYADVPMPRLYFERILRYELTVRGTWSCVSAPFPGKEWPNAIEMVGDKRVRIEDMITHRLNLSEGPDVFQRLIGGKEIFGKVMFYPEEDQDR